MKLYYVYIRYILALVLAGSIAMPAEAVISLRDYTTPGNCAAASAIVGGWAGFAFGRYVQEYIHTMQYERDNCYRYGCDVKQHVEHETDKAIHVYFYDIQDMCQKLYSNIRQASQHITNTCSLQVNHAVESSKELKRISKNYNSQSPRCWALQVKTQASDLQSNIENLQENLKNSIKKDARQKNKAIAINTIAEMLSNKIVRIQNDVDNIDASLQRKYDVQKSVPSYAAQARWLPRLLPTAMAAVGMFAGYGLYNFCAGGSGCV